MLMNASPQGLLLRGGVYCFAAVVTITQCTAFLPPGSTRAGAVSKRALQAAGGWDPTGNPQLACDTEPELFEGLHFLSDVCCVQAGEDCSDLGVQWPRSCRTLVCARSVLRVSGDCGSFLATSAFFDGQKKLLADLMTTCRGLDSADADALGFNALGDGQIVTDVCGKVINDGKERARARWTHTVQLQAPQGQVIQVDVEEQWLAPDDYVKICDGVSDCLLTTDTGMLTKLAGTQRFATPIVSTNRTVSMQQVDNTASDVKPTMSGWSIRITCNCTKDGGCSGHGACSPAGQCVCDHGWRGQSCELRDLCALSPCLNGATCTQGISSVDHASEHYRHRMQDTGGCSMNYVATVTTELNTQCCGTDDPACNDGMPSGCDAGCAAVFLPFWARCSATWSQFRPLVALCEISAQGQQKTCECARGWRGDNCEYATGCDSHPCFHGRCVANGTWHRCDCDLNWGGPSCTQAVRGFDTISSHIEGATAEELAVIEEALPREYRSSEWRLCYDSRTDCISCPSTECDDCSCRNSSQRTFHGGCDTYTETLVLGHTSQGTFGGFAQASWKKGTSPNQPDGYGGDIATGATENFLFRLGNRAAIYRVRGQGRARYQDRDVGYWPIWGDQPDTTCDLSFGYWGALGDVECYKGDTYKSSNGDVCGTTNEYAYEEGDTQMEVWYRVQN
jgi:hypothetical protein